MLFELNRHNTRWPSQPETAVACTPSASSLQNVTTQQDLP
jgi:hypothetical protein